MSEITGFTADTAAALPLYVLDREQFASWKDGQPAATQAWLASQGFTAGAFTTALLPGADGLAGAVIGVGDRGDAYSYSHAPHALPEGSVWQLASELPAAELALLQLGWGLGSYRFDRYRKRHRAPARLVAEPTGEVADLIAASLRVRDWVNTPTEDMGPQQLEDAARALADAHGAQVEAITGDELLKQNFPAIHAVGRASHRAPRLVVLRWGKDTDPALVLVGKGVTFDTGGISIKPAAGMEDMKWDMGGAGAVAGAMKALALRKAKANVIGVCGLVENMPDGNAQRPGDVVTSMSGQTIEVINTDAEGRLVLCDAITWVQKTHGVKTIVDLATLTGAMIVSLGNEYGGLFSNDDGLADKLLAAGTITPDEFSAIKARALS